LEEGQGETELRRKARVKMNGRKARVKMN